MPVSLDAPNWEFRASQLREQATHNRRSILAFIVGKQAGGSFILVLCLAATLARAQDQQQQQQSVPDAPSATRPPQQFPTTSPPTNTQPRPSKEPPKSDSPPRSDEPATSSDQPAPGSEEPAPTPPPMPPVKTVPGGGATPDTGGAREDLYKITANVNFVLVPVTVKDDDGHLVSGLLPKILRSGKTESNRSFASLPAIHFHSRRRWFWT